MLRTKPIDERPAPFLTIHFAGGFSKFRELQKSQLVYIDHVNSPSGFY